MSEQLDKATAIGVIGAGTMGGGIAMNFANVGIPVTIVMQQMPAWRDREQWSAASRHGSQAAPEPVAYTDFEGILRPAATAG